MTTLVAVSDQSSNRIQPAYPRAAGRSYSVELPLELLDEGGDTLDWVIGFTLDILNAHHLELRIVAEPSAKVIAHTPGAWTSRTLQGFPKGSEASSPTLIPKS